MSFARHADARAQARLGETITLQDRHYMIQMIAAGRATQLRGRYTDDAGHVLEAWLVPMPDGRKKIPVVYDPIRRWIVSILGPDYRKLGTNLGDLLQSAQRAKRSA